MEYKWRLFTWGTNWWTIHPTKIHNFCFLPRTL